MAVLVSMAALGASAQPVLGSAGAIDRAFGRGGMAATGLAQARGFIALGEGSSVVVGSSVAVRLTPGGAKDATFGSGGRAVLPGATRAVVAAAQSGRRVVLAGFGGREDALPSLGPVSRFAAGRLLENGRPDPTFGRGGGVVLPWLSSGGFTARDAYATAVAVQPDGKVLVAGPAYARYPGLDLKTPVPESRFAVARLDRAGKLDRSFGRHGVALIPVRGSRVAVATSVAVLRGGRIAVAGNGSIGERSNHAATGLVARLTPSGHLDRGFGAGGLARLAPAGFERVNLSAVVALPGGRLVVGGWAAAADGNDSFLVARLLASGGTDDSFGAGGATVTPEPAGGWGLIHGLAVDAVGRVVAAGVAFYTGLPPVPARGVLLRYRPDGTLDPAFGTAGIAGLGEFLRSAAAVAIQRPSGALLVLGDTPTNSAVSGVVRVAAG